MSETLPQRKNIRFEYHDYSGGNYFVTICTGDKKHYFGKIIETLGTHSPCVRNEMILTPVGKFCYDQLCELPKHYPYAEVPLFVVMPNHIHAIIIVKDDSGMSTADEGLRTHEPCVPTIRTALSVIVGGLKRAVTMYARRNNIDFCWQKRYHDHIIRGTRDGNMIASYIETNIDRWNADCYHPNNQ